MSAERLETKRRGRVVSARREVAEQNRIRGSYERRLAVQLRALFDSLAVDASRAYGVGGQPNLFLGTVTNRVAEVLVPHYRSVILAMADRFRTIKVKQDFEQIVRSYLQANAAERIQGIANTTRNQIRKALLEASAEGLGQVAAAKVIEDRVGGAIGRRRANLIARTETHAAASFANHETAKSFGVPMRKQWVATNDGRTRSWHSSVNGQTVDMDEDFIVPYKGVEYRMKHTGDPNGGAHNTINCRCVTVYLEPDDVVTDDLPKEPPAPKPDEKDFINVAPLVRTLSRGSVGAEQFNTVLNAALTVATARAAKRAGQPREIQEAKSGAIAYYDERIKSHTRNGTFEHEYGHFVDFRIGRIRGVRNNGNRPSWSEQNLTKPMRADQKLNGLKLRWNEGMREKLDGWNRDIFDRDANGRAVPKFEGAELVSDIIDAHVGGEFRRRYRAWGHSKNYWKEGGAKENEIFANLFAIQNKPQALAFVEKNFPNLQQAFLEEIERFGSGA